MYIFEISIKYGFLGNPFDLFKDNKFSCHLIQESMCTL
jgi:hypothetical protein